MAINLQYKNKDTIIEMVEKAGVYILQYPMISNLEFVKHGISTRLGGVSEGVCSTMNLSFSRGDKDEYVRENFKRMGLALEIDEESFTFSAQTHTTNIKVIKEEDKGKGLTKELDYSDVDGLITNIPGICLSTFYADCVPLFFIDPVNRVIGLSHSGWRGTVGKIGKITIGQMTKEFNTSPKDVITAIGPSICQDCYEVNKDVILEFQTAFDQRFWNDLYYKKENGKYQLNLWKANELVLLEAGIQPSHLVITNLCTCCNEKWLFSHRASHGERGNLGAFLMLK